LPLVACAVGVDKGVAERILNMFEKERLVSAWNRNTNSRRVIDPSAETAVETCGELSDAESARSKRHRIAAPRSQSGSQHSLQGSETQQESEPPRKPRKVSHAKRPIKSASSAPAPAPAAALPPWPAPPSRRSLSQWG